MLQRDSSVTVLVRLDVGRLDGLVRKLGISEVRSDQQAQTEQHDRKTEQGADQLARHSRRPRDGTCFNVFLRTLILRARINRSSENIVRSVRK